MFVFFISLFIYLSWFKVYLCIYLFQYLRFNYFSTSSDLSFCYLFIYLFIIWNYAAGSVIYLSVSLLISVLIYLFFYYKLKFGLLSINFLCLFIYLFTSESVLWLIYLFHWFIYLFMYSQVSQWFVYYLFTDFFIYFYLFQYFVLTNLFIYFKLTADLFVYLFCIYFELLVAFFIDSIN